MSPCQSRIGRNPTPRPASAPSTARCRRRCPCRPAASAAAVGRGPMWRRSTRVLRAGSAAPASAPGAVLGTAADRDVLAENLRTADPARHGQHRVHDYADVYTLTGRHTITDALAPPGPAGGRRPPSPAGHRQPPPVPLRPDRAAVYGDRQPRPTPRRHLHLYCTALGPAGTRPPTDFDAVVTAVTRFADRLATPAPARASESNHPPLDPLTTKSTLSWPEQRIILCSGRSHAHTPKLVSG